MRRLVPWLLAASVAHAEVPLPDYTNEVVVAAWFDVDRLIDEACMWQDDDPDAGLPPMSGDARALDKAIVEAERFMEVVRRDGRLLYLVGLAHRHAGRLDHSERALAEAVELAPDRPEAWRELGELRTLRGAHEQAAAAFRKVTELVPEGPTAWVGWFQLAQEEAHLRMAAKMEAHLLEALRHGFSFQLVVDNPAWQEFFSDPALRRPLERLVTVYGAPELRRTLDGPQPTEEPAP